MQRSYESKVLHGLLTSFSSVTKYLPLISAVAKTTTNCLLHLPLPSSKINCTLTTETQFQSHKLQPFLHANQHFQSPFQSPHPIICNSARIISDKNMSSTTMNNNVLADKDINASAAASTKLDGKADIKSMEYHRQILQSKLEEGQ